MNFNSKKNTVLFLGAGISYCAGVPTQEEILKIITTNKDISNSNIGKDFLKFLTKIFGYKNNSNLPPIEEIYSFLDFFITQNEHLNNVYNVDKLRSISKIFTQLICQVIETEHLNKKRNLSNSTYEQFWSELLIPQNRISIITTNYDSCLFESFDKQYSQGYLLNYNVDFANYYQDYQDYIHPFFWWEKANNDFNNEKIVNVYKLHGSIDWLYCACCNKVLYTPFIHANYNLENGELKEPFMYSEIINKKEIAKCPVDKCKYEILIQPPKYNKNFSNSILKNLYFKSLYELKNADNIIFIGYSFPSADYHIKALFNRINLKNKKIIVIDKQIDGDKERKYLSIDNDILFKEITFEKCIKYLQSYIME